MNNDPTLNMTIEELIEYWQTPRFEDSPIVQYRRVVQRNATAINGKATGAVAQRFTPLEKQEPKYQFIGHVVKIDRWRVLIKGTHYIGVFTSEDKALDAYNEVCEKYGCKRQEKKG